MPQVDLETLVSACAGVSCDRKIACETLVATTADNQNRQPQDSDSNPPEIPPDFPPESFWLSKDAELDWFDRNAFIERKDSTKGSNSHSTNLNPHINPLSGIQSNSQRFSSLKSKPSIIGLPKPQKSCFVEVRRHCKPGNTRLFPKRSGSVSKSDSSVIEPSSPKVSCMGRVRSKKDRNRRLRNRQQSGRSNETDSKREKPERKQRTRFFSTFRAIFRATKHNKKTSKEGSISRKSSTAKETISDIRERLPAGDRDSQLRKSVDNDGSELAAAGSEAVGLGGMKWFASGRKSESWIDVA